MKPKFAVLVLDGYGVDPALEDAILEDLVEGLAPGERSRLTRASRAVGQEEYLPLLRPNTATAAPVLELQASGRAGAALSLSRLLWERRQRLIEAVDPVWFEETIDRRLREVAARFHYAPWVAPQSWLFEQRSIHPTFLTRASGEAAGYEKLDIEIQGNSDTGHQQMFNLCVAEQASHQIGRAFQEGRVEELLEAAVQEMAGPEPKRDVLFLKTLLSGEFGDDGFVHSCLSHLLRVIDLALALLARYHLPSERLQILAVLDGRDSPPDSSICGEERSGRRRFDFLGQLQRYLAERGAAGCLTRIIGRQYMDRNYRGDLIRREIDLLTGRSRAEAQALGAFRRAIFDLDPARQPAADLPTVLAADLAEAREAIGLCHARGLKDSEIPPIHVGPAPDMGPRSVLFNLIFRADRQEPSVATLLGMREFVREQAEQKQTVDTWGWFLQADLGLQGLSLLTMIDYHPELTAAGVRCVLPIHPHDHNLLHLMSTRLEGFRFLLAGEGVKEKHMGLFARGRRATPIEGAEERIIIPSCGLAEGVAGDDELWRVPGMRHREISQALLARLGHDAPPLVAANFPGPDMIGHLIEQHFDACVETLSSIEAILVDLVAGLHACGYVVILTSDHGNVEHYGPDHGVNPVLTTFVAPPSLDRALLPIDGTPGRAMLYDIPHTILALTKLHDCITRGLEYPVERQPDGGFRAVGQPLLQWEG